MWEVAVVNGDNNVGYGMFILDDCSNEECAAWLLKNKSNTTTRRMQPGDAPRIMSPINRYDENLVSLVAELHLYEEKIVLVNITTAY